MEKKEGVIATYTHNNGRIGAMIEINTQTDFAAKTELFQNLAHDLAMQVAAMGGEDLDKQVFIKNPEVTVGDHIAEVRKELGEEVTVGRVVRHVL
jgi:elongation factor Ts